MNQSGYSPTPPPAAIDLDLAGMLRRRWKHVALGVLAGLAIGVGYYLTATPLYRSELSVLVGQRSSELTAQGTSDESFAGGSTLGDDVLATHMGILTSPRILQDAVDTAKLGGLFSFRQAAARGVSPSEHLKAQLEVSRGGDGATKDANVLSATFSDPRPEDAVRVLKAVYQSYQRYVEQQSKNHSEEAARLIREAQKTHEVELAEADRAYRQFISSVPVFVDGDQVEEVHRERLASLEQELSEVRSKIAETKSRSEVINAYMNRSDRDSMTDVDRLALLSEKEVQRLKLFLDVTQGDFRSQEFAAAQPLRQETARAQYTRLLNLYQKQRKLAEDYGPRHPTVVANMKEIEVTKEFIAQNAPEDTFDKKSEKLTAAEMLAAYRSLLTNDLAELTNREAALMQSARRERDLAKQVEADFMKGQALKAKLERAQTRYDEVLRRLQEINLSGNYAGFSTDLLATPKPADDPHWPSLALCSALGLLLGGILGLTSGVAAELSNTTFRSAKDLEASLGASVLAHVAPFSLPKLREMVGRESNLAPQLCAFHGPRSLEAEVYRAARTSLLLNCKKHRRQVLMMTSAAPGDGKSTTVANLAISLAQAGKRVLLIDADLRRPTLYHVFGAQSRPGVADVVDETMQLADAVQPTEQANLDLLTHGTRTAAPAELLESMPFATVLDEARRQYDLVLIDAPPVLAVTDPAIIAAQADGTLLTVRVSKNGRRPVERACEVLREVQFSPVGVIVNNSGGRAHGFGYSHDDYGDTYGYVGQYYSDYAVDDPVDTPPPAPVAPPHASPPAREMATR